MQARLKAAPRCHFLPACASYVYTAFTIEPSPQHRHWLRQSKHVGAEKISFTPSPFSTACSRNLNRFYATFGHGHQLARHLLSPRALWYRRMEVSGHFAQSGLRGRHNAPLLKVPRAAGISVFTAICHEWCKMKKNWSEANCAKFLCSRVVRWRIVLWFEPSFLGAQILRF